MKAVQQRRAGLPPPANETILWTAPMGDAIRLLLVRVAAEKALPFEIKVPNAETRAAMAEVERGGGASFDSVADLMAELNAKD